MESVEEHKELKPLPSQPSAGSEETVHTSKPGPSPPKLRLLAAALFLIVSTSLGFLGGWVGNRSADQNNANVQKQQVILKSQGQLISNIAKTVGASVVSVETTTRSLNSDNFFGLPSSREAQGAGTGIIISDGGLVMTNRHVVPAGTTNVSVTLSDGTVFEDVQVIGRTRSTDSLDIAFLKIKDTKGKKLSAAILGDSSKMQVGDPAVAIGNALGQFQNTVTSGIISGYGRSLQAGDGSESGSENLEDLFQTDAAINQGNSGGPLVNLDGEVIGINTAIAGNAQNIGFAIPINDVSGLVKSVKETGKLQRPYLGVVYIAITDDTAKQYKLSVSRGAYIPPASVLGQDPIISGSPADKAGLKEGDIITKVDKESVDQINSLTALLGKRSVGDKVKLTIIRDDKQKTVEVSLGSAPSE